MTDNYLKIGPEIMKLILNIVNSCDSFSKTRTMERFDFVKLPGRDRKLQ